MPPPITIADVLKSNFALPNINPAAIEALLAFVRSRQYVTIWIKAFIPGDVPGVTKPRPGSPNETIVTAPIGGCFATDNRTYSDLVSASARIHSQVTLDLNNKTKLNEVHFAGATHQVDCSTGWTTGIGFASTAQVGFGVPVETSVTTMKLPIRPPPTTR